MIEIKTAEPYRRCNCCYSSNNVSDLFFRDGCQGTIVALCSSCMDELREKIKESEDLHGN